MESYNRSFFLFKIITLTLFFLCYLLFLKWFVLNWFSIIELHYTSGYMKVEMHKRGSLHLPRQSNWKLQVKYKIHQFDIIPSVITHIINIHIYLYIDIYSVIPIFPPQIKQPGHPRTCDANGQRWPPRVKSANKTKQKNSTNLNVQMKFINIYDNYYCIIYINFNKTNDIYIHNV